MAPPRPVFFLLVPHAYGSCQAATGASRLPAYRPTRPGAHMAMAATVVAATAVASVVVLLSAHVTFWYFEWWDVLDTSTVLVAGVVAFISGLPWFAMSEISMAVLTGAVDEVVEERERERKERLRRDSARAARIATLDGHGRDRDEQELAEVYRLHKEDEERGQAVQLRGWEYREERDFERDLSARMRDAPRNQNAVHRRRRPQD